ncbi:hypothetical protein [Pseudomonas citronellolis]|uniref:hypothetical protein n=1 Tax=Pseudomonas citronellolis TaxID=53408 RepID=UPI0023E412B3|nr:hypothetical protein [Pseudomonas citronellolis]MDF3936694.1 hypothetical protein [Pseudomonas citronellolis]
MECKITPSRRAEDAAHLAALVEASGIQPQQVTGFTDVKPMPPRSKRIDPSTILWRKRPGITQAERRLLRKLAEAL